MIKNGKKIILSVVLVVSLALVIAVAFWIGDSMYGSEVDGEVDIDAIKNATYIDGELCYPKTGVKNYLIMGIDKFGEDEDALGQADFLMVLSFDSNTKTYTMVSINRDTMVDVDEYDGFGGHRVVNKQIALSYSKSGGDGLVDKKNCINTEKAVSRILCGMKFDGYMSMTMDAVAILVDSLGGIRITIDEDLTSVDERLVVGEVLLDGELALKYVRARGGLVDSSNIARMNRQERFLQAFFAKVSETELGETRLLGIYDQIRPYICNDSGDVGYEKLFSKLSEYSAGDKISLKGEAKIGDGGYVEFDVDEAHVKEVVLDVFYEKAKK